MSRCYKTVEIVSSGRSMGEGAGGVHCGLLVFIGVEEEQETSAPPPKKNPESTPGM